MDKEAYIVKDNSYLCHVEHNYTEQAYPTMVVWPT